MSRGLLAKVSRLLYRPLFGTFVVPKDARVDPALFSEEDFPVFCPKCRYSLRGLRDGLCPECGQPFERGGLLVRQYVFEWGEALWRRTRLGRVSRWCVVGAFICVACPALALVGICLYYVYWLFGRADFPSAQEEVVLDWLFGVLRASIPLTLVGLVILCTFGVLWWFPLRRYAKKRRAVIGALRAAAGADEVGADD